MEQGFNIVKAIGHNFQSHKHTEVDFSSGLTVVVGESDQGKTSFFQRLLKWVLTNDLTGDSFVRNNDEGKVDKDGNILKEELCYGTIIFENGISLTRKRKKSKNIYELITEDGELLEFENFGNNIPEPITSLIPINKIIVDKDLKIDPNFPPKKESGILAKNNVTKTKMIGSLAGTNILDAAIRLVQADIKNIGMEESSLRKDIEKLDEKIEVFGDMEYKSQLIEKGDVLHKDIENNQTSISKLVSFHSDLEKKKSLEKELDEIIKGKIYFEEEEKYINEIQEKIEKISSIKETYERLCSLSNKLEDKKANLKLNEEIIANKQKVIDTEMSIKNLEMKIENIKISSTNTKMKLDLVGSLKTRIENLVQNTKEQEGIITKKDTILKLEKNLEKYNDIILDTTTKNNSLKTLVNFNTLIKDKVLSISKLDLVIDKKKEVLSKEKDLKTKELKINQLNEESYKIKETLNKITTLYSDLKNKIEKEEKGGPILDKMRENLENLIKEYIKNVENLGKCPVCYSDLTEEHMANIRTELLSAN